MIDRELFAQGAGILAAVLAIGLVGLLSYTRDVLTHDQPAIIGVLFRVCQVLLVVIAGGIIAATTPGLLS